MKKTCKQKHRARRKGGIVQKVGLDPTSYLDYEQIMYVLNYCRNRVKRAKKSKDCHDARPVITLILLESYFYTGLRATELLGLQLQDLPQYHSHSFIRVPGEFTKNGKQRTVRVNQLIINKWTVYIERFHKIALKLIGSGDRAKKEKGLSTPLILNEWGKPMEYSSVYGRIKTVARHTGYELWPHLCRHTYATQLLQASGSLPEVQDALGHSNPSTTRVYAKTINPIAQQNLERLNFG